jgi:hypothetical protein
VTRGECGASMGTLNQYLRSTCTTISLDAFCAATRKRCAVKIWVFSGAKRTKRTLSRAQSAQSPANRCCMRASIASDSSLASDRSTSEPTQFPTIGC